MAANVRVLVSSFLNQESKQDNHISTLLKCVQENQCLQDNDNCKEWIAKVNSFLNSKTDRWLGISLLAATIQQCDTDIFSANCTTWIRSILHAIQSPSSSTSLIQCSVKLMDDLIKYAIQFPDLSRTLANSVIQTLISTLLSLKEKDICSTLSGICSCVRYMPGPAAPFRGQIENYIIPYLDSWNVNIRKNACLCFSLLAGCSTPSAEKLKTNWELQWSRVLATIYHTLNNLYENIEMSGNTKDDSFLCKTELLPFSGITNEEPTRTNVLTTRLISLLDCLNTMIREGSPRITAIPIDETLSEIEEILAVNENMLKNNVSIDVVLLKTCLAIIHESAVRLLCGLILRCGSLLLPNNSRISNMLIKELSWTSDIQSHNRRDERHKPYSNLRCAVFKCYINWVQMKGCLSTDDVKKITRNIFNDIRPQTRQSKLVMQEDQKQPKSSKKARKRIKLQEMEQLTTSQEKINPLDNVSVCHTALSALYAILMNNVTNITKDIYQEIQCLLLDLILQCQVSLPGRLPSPYSDPDCRKEIYHCLLASIVARPHQVPTAIQWAIRCFTQGLQDTHNKVSSYCQEALTISTALIHPVVPSLGSAVQFVMIPMNGTRSVTQNTGQNQVTSPLTNQPSVLDVALSHQCTTVHDFDVQRSDLDIFEKLNKIKEKEETAKDGGSSIISIMSQAVHENAVIDVAGDTQESTANAHTADVHQGSKRELKTKQAKESPRHFYDIHSVHKDQPTDVSEKDNTVSDDINIIPNSGSSFETMQGDSRSCLFKTDNLTDIDSIGKPSKKPKLDTESAINIDNQNDKMEESGWNNHDGAKIQEKKTGLDEGMEDVDEMLASFVNSSPDSDSE